MLPSPNEITLEIKPQKRFDLIDIREQVSRKFDNFLDQYRKSYYCSYHTTAGYFEQSLCARLHHDRDNLTPFIRAFQKIFPSNANYRHDELKLRTELTEDERKCEPKNADSHLIFMSSGLKNCVKYENQPKMPVYFVDLDGVNGSGSRTRRTTVLGFNEEKTVNHVRFKVPVSKHPIDSINLRGGRSSLLEELDELIRRLEVSKGKVDISLPADERNAGLTVNEYETLLMRHDLTEVLRNPVRFMAMQGKHMLLDPAAIPNKTINYAKYDLVQVFNELMDALHISESVVEKILTAFMRVPAARFFRMKRRISLPISDAKEPGRGQLMLGRYQSPILVQWKRAAGQTRHLDVRIKKFR